MTTKMTIFSLVLIAFLVSLFIGTKSVCIGLGIVVAILTLIQLADIMKWLD